MQRSQSLQARFRTAVLTIAAVLLVVVTVAVHVSSKSYYLSNGADSARASVAAVSQTLSVGVYARDDVLLKELVGGLSRHPSVARVVVEDTKGTVLASAEDPPTDDGPAVEVNAPWSFTSKLVSPFRPTETLGRLDVWLDTRRLAADATRQAALVAGALVVLLATVLIALNEVASRLLSRPMHRLAAQMALIVPGTELRLPLEPKHERDEVGVVTLAANRLLDLQQVALERERSMLEAITALEARYRGIFASTSAGIFILSAQGSLRQANPALGRLLGMDAERSAADGAPNFAATVFAEPLQLTELVDRARASQQPEAADLELIHSNGSALWAHCMVSLSVDASTGEECVEGVLYNVTQRKLQESAAQYTAEHDALTGLKSRAYVEAALDLHIKAARSDGRGITLLFIDLDGFKAVNDMHGHAAGDAVLVEAAHRLRQLFKRGSDVVGRLGGDELVVIIVDIEAIDERVAQMASKLIEVFKVPVPLPSGKSAIVGASVGVASFPLHANGAETLMQAADTAMYAVKQAGKGGYGIADIDRDRNDDRPSSWQGGPSDRRRTSKSLIDSDATLA